MAASVQLRQLQNRDLGMAMREVDEDLAIFLGMRSSQKKTCGREDESDEEDFNDSNGAKPDSLLIQKASEPAAGTDDSSPKLETQRSDYDWLLVQADTSLLPPEEINPQDTALNLYHPQISNGDDSCVPLKQELDNAVEESASQSQSDRWMQQPASSPSPSSSCIQGNIRSSASEDQKPTRTTSACASASASSKARARASTPTTRDKSKPTRASTPTPIARSALPSSKPMAAQSRSSTPGPGRPTSRSSTPAAAASRSSIKLATPTTTPSTTSASSGRKTTTTISKNPVLSRGTSPTVKSRPSKPTEMLSLSHDGAQNLKPFVTKRPASASRGRPTAPGTHSRQKSCSPAKARGPATTAHKTGSKLLSRSRGDGDDVNPVLMGTKMVNRVVNMRKLAPPKQDEYISHDNHKKSSYENSGFGRSLSKSSLDMAIRHMDIGRSMGENLRPVATGPSSVRIRTGFSKSGAIGVLESPPSSSCDSSKSSICNNSHFLNGTELDY